MFMAGLSNGKNNENSFHLRFRKRNWIPEEAGSSGLGTTSPRPPQPKYVSIWNVKKIFLLLEKKTKDVESLKVSLQAEKEFKSKVLKTSIKCHAISYIPDFKHHRMNYFYPIRVLQKESVPI